jgi:propionate CoA-transferase
MRFFRTKGLRPRVSAGLLLQYPINKRFQPPGPQDAAGVLTKRAAFQVESDGLTLIEVAKGIDVREDVLGQMEFRPKRIADPLPYMEETLFAD